MNSPNRVILADDHAVLRSGLRLLLTSQNEFEVVGEASSGIETLSLAEQLQPDLILLDLSMPALGGLDALPALRKLVPSTRILILTMHDDPQYLRQALKHGASGYVLKKAADALKNDPFFQDKKNKGLADILKWLLANKRRCEQQSVFTVDPRDPTMPEKIIVEKIKRGDYL